MRKTKFALSLSLGALLISSCASAPKYEVTSEKTTQLRAALIEGPVSNLPNDLTGETMYVKIFEPGACENGLEFGFLHSPNDEKARAGALDMPLGAYSKSSVHEGLIETHKTHRVEVLFSILNGSPLFGKVEKCMISTNYQFEDGVDYEFVGVMEAFDACSVKVNKLVSSSDGATRQLVQTLTHIDNPAPQACMTEDEKE